MLTIFLVEVAKQLSWCLWSWDQGTSSPAMSYSMAPRWRRVVPPECPKMCHQLKYLKVEKKQTMLQNKPETKISWEWVRDIIIVHKDH